MISFIIGSIIGGCIGFMAAALLSVNKHEDD